MTPGRKTNLHHVPYDGNIETHIDDSRASVLMIANETPEVSRTLMAQIQRMTDANVEGFRYALPAIGGVLVSCDNPQQAYDAIYGSMTAPVAKMGNVVPFKQFSSINLNAVFALEAQNNNGIHHAPDAKAALARAATSTPALEGFDYEARALVA